MTAAPIIVELRGRLGNQLSQFAATYALCRRLDAPLRFSSRRLGSEPLLLPDLLGARYQEATSAELRRVGVPAGPEHWWELAERHAARAWARARRRPLLLDLRADGVDPRPLLAARPPILVRGWFELEELFADAIAAVDAAIELPSVEGILPPTLPRPVVAVSFRRGDFARWSRLLPFSYYEDALTLLTRAVQPGTILLFGDDPDFCDLAASRLQRFGPTVNALQWSDDPLINLAMLATADHSVLANSTFAWWGAWLAAQRGDHSVERFVYTPSAWYFPDGVREVVAERWDVAVA
jgi:hypothetical protein